MNFIKITPTWDFSGQTLYNLLQNEALKIAQSIPEKLAIYDKNSAIEVWRRFVMYLDEFINVFYELDPIDAGIVSNTPIGIFRDSYPELLEESLLIIEQKFGKDISNRFLEFINLFDRFPMLYNLMPAMSIGQILDFCQARRLHYVSMLYLIAKYANGNKKVNFSNVINEFQYYIENMLMLLTTAYHGMLQCKCIKDFGAKMYLDRKVEFNKYYTQLDKYYLEPQNLSIYDLIKYSTKIDHSKLRIKTDCSLYSLEEYDVMLYNDKIVYKNYGLLENPKYLMLYEFFIYMEKYFIDDYHIKVNIEEYDKLRKLFPSIIPFNDSETVFDIQNSRYAFYKVDNIFYSNYFLLLRFYVNKIQELLRKNKSFQVDAGFIFEKKVSEIVEKYGFSDQKITRINHKEFDVVCVKNKIIYNFQCKNNFLDVTQIDLKNVDRSVKYNKYLASYYNRALKKEHKQDRENLLKEKLKLDTIEHFVVSRFPIITDNTRVIAFNQLESRLADIAQK